MAQQTDRERWGRYLQSRIDHAKPYGMTFYHLGILDGAGWRPAEGLTEQQRVEVERFLEYRFKQWAQSWIQPAIDEMLGNPGAFKV